MEAEQAMWPRAEHLLRVFFIRSGKQSGTASAVDVGGKQYFVTALHVVEEAMETCALDFFRDNAWRSTAIVVIGMSFEHDIAVFACHEPVVRNLNIAFDVAGGIAAGQEAFFLGFPLGIKGHLINTGYPIPVIKRGVVALFHPGPPRHILLSASANPGFSGGPLYFKHPQTGQTTLGAVIIESLAYEIEVTAPGDNEATASKDEKAVVGIVAEDSHLVRCSYIGVAHDLIVANPKGNAP